MCDRRPASTVEWRRLLAPHRPEDAARPPRAGQIVGRVCGVKIGESEALVVLPHQEALHAQKADPLPALLTLTGGGGPGSQPIWKPAGFDSPTGLSWLGRKG